MVPIGVFAMPCSDYAQIGAPLYEGSQKLHLPIFFDISIAQLETG
jgi:hypothetical protein